jgi:ketosteroid isomerase-like protein
MENHGDDLRRVADELAIRRLVAQYADGVTRNDEDTWIGTWADDGSWTLGGNTSTGHANLLATWKGLMALFETVVQLPQHGLLELSGDRATGHWVVVELGRTASGGSSSSVGTYHDCYRRVESGWKFSERRFEFIYTGPPDLSGHWFA